MDWNLGVSNDAIINKNNKSQIQCSMPQIANILENFSENILQTKTNGSHTARTLQL
jgi:hypothetical protein